MNRRSFIHQSTASSALVASSALSATAMSAGKDAFSFELSELSVAELQRRMTSGETTAEELTKLYLRRIEDVDQHGPKLRSVIELNPEALAIAKALDQERKEQGSRGPLHGIPMLIKDNIGTHDRMMTTAGSLALVGSIAPSDAFVVKQLREAGAVVLGKTNLSEWANFRSWRSVSGWSGRGGLTRNPYALDHSASGSSSGSAAAVCASLCAVAVGTETNGSIVSPASHCGIVGIKPTVGLISRSGIIPISASQDTAGPMARTVADAAALLGGMTGVDESDAATRDAGTKMHRDYSEFLDAKALCGARLGVARSLFFQHPQTDGVWVDTLAALQREGAVLVDPADLPSRKELGGISQMVMLYEFKAGLNAYLAALGDAASVKTLRELMEFNEKHQEQEMPFFDQEILSVADSMGPLTDEAYLDAKAKCEQWSRTEGIDAVMEKHQLDAIIAPTCGPAHALDLIHGDHGLGGSSTYAAVAGYPAITVPAGFVRGLPMGLTFFGRAWSEPRLIALGYAFEQATKVRQAPQFLASVSLE